MKYLDCDGYVDIAIANQQINTSYIYWGSASGYSETNRTKIHDAVDGSGSLIFDFNNDVTLDILVDGRHEPGNYTIEWSGNDDHNQTLPEGIYYLIYKSGDGSKDLTTFKIVHIKK